jgi:hypothetical protein
VLLVMAFVLYLVEQFFRSLLDGNALKILETVLYVWGFFMLLAMPICIIAGIYLLSTKPLPKR